MKKTNWLLIVLALVLSMFLAACSGGDSANEDNTGNNEGNNTGNNEEPAGDEEPAEEKILRLAASAEIPSMDPALPTDSTSFQMLDSVYEGLYRIAPGGEIVSGVADMEQTEVSEDGLTWTFNLREDAKWSNGEPVTAHDFVYAWQRAINPDTASAYGEYMLGGNVVNASEIYAGDLPVEDLGISAPDDFTFVVELTHPIPYFSSIAAFPTLFPLNQDFVESQGDQFALEADTGIYNGPFVMTSWEHEASWTLEKNDQYWDAENVGLDGIEYNVFKDSETALSNYEVGELDRVGLSGAEQVNANATNPEFQGLFEAVVFWLKFNQDSATVGEHMQNVNFRTALATAFDKQAFIDMVYPGSTPANYFVPSEFVQHPETGEDFREGQEPMLEFDLEAAQEAWATAKEEVGFEEVTISFLSGDTDTSKRIAEFFKTELERNLPGLTLEAVNVPWAQQLEIMDAKEYELTFSGWGPDYGDAISFVDLWHSENPNNDIGYSNPDYDALVDSTKEALVDDPAARFEALQEAETMALEDAAIGPVVQRKTNVLSKPYVTGMDALNPFGPSYSMKFVDIQK